MALCENILQQIKLIWNNNFIYYLLRFGVFIMALNVLILNVDDMLI